MTHPQASQQSAPTIRRRPTAPTEPGPRYRCSICRKFTEDIDGHLQQSHPR